MQRPSPGELLKGLRQSLAETVLPALPKGVAHQQLKAALHLIGRLERSWDLAAPHLAADNADIEGVLARLLPAEGPDSLAARLATAPSGQVDGYNDQALGAAAARNLALHRLLLDIPDHDDVTALHARMVARDAHFVGDSPAGNGVGE
jgi:hypothetical protein